jgi:hypothetical protein
MGMAAKKLEPAEAASAEPGTGAMVQFNVRVPAELVPALDAWLTETNAKHRFKKRKRSDLVRDGLIWLVEHKPDLGGK